MSERLRALQSQIAAGLSALPELARSAAPAFVERARLLMDDVRAMTAELSQSMAQAIAPSIEAPQASTTDDASEFSELLADLGAEAPTPEQIADGMLADTTIRSLSENLHGLRDLGDQLARAEQEKLVLAARVEELQGAGAADAQDERLARKLEQRECALERTRERLAEQRARTDEWKRKAAERWHEIVALRKRVKELEGARGEASGANPPAALPKRSASRSKRRGSRAS